MQESELTWFTRMQSLVESIGQRVDLNAKAIQAMLDNQAEARLEREEFRDKTDAAIARIDEAIQRLTNLNEGVVKIVTSLDSDRPTILAKLNSIDNKINRLLERGE